ncbi:unnamed protein product [Cuscuta campestris]|uniref:HMA domain-containing protein n=1 Tax=Cuscuta campestris TaxID=132261 RepID=A0A484MTS7_9ASTE|nr:unnamed protein product [Cuscuta campestris]
MMFIKSIDRFFCFSPASTAAAQPGRRRVERLGGGHTPRSRNSTSQSSSPWVNPVVESRRKSSSDVPDNLRRSGTSAAAAATPPGSPFIDHLLAINSKNVKAALFKKRQSSNEPSGVLRRPWPASKFPTATPKNSNKADSLSSTPIPRRNHQVVELRVSIHCKGCERKVKKHLSKMEGVTWYSVDACTQKVTVVGEVSPLGVLVSISKVMKNAQFW